MVLKLREDSEVWWLIANQTQCVVVICKASSVSHLLFICVYNSFDDKLKTTIHHIPM